MQTKTMERNEMIDSNGNELEPGDICFFWDEVDLHTIIGEPEAYSHTADMVSHLDSQGRYITDSNFHFDYCIKLRGK